MSQEWMEAGRRLAALETAAQEFFDEGYAWPMAERELKGTPAELQDEAWGKLMPKRTAADGYFTWLHHLVWLERVREVCPQLPLTATEVEGMLVLRRVRDKFLREHPPCPACGEVNEQLALNCRKCGKELR